MKVKDMNEFERPREKCLRYGINYLSNRELLALLLRTGTRQKSALEVADMLLQSFPSLGMLGKASMEELMNIDGIKVAKAVELQAAFAIGRRIAFEQLRDKEEITSPSVLVNWLLQEIGYEQQEHFVVVFLNQRNQIITYKVLFIGTLTSANVHPREIFKEAMKYSSAKIICAHNHPSGGAQISEADIAITQKIQECGDITSIPLIDHLVIGHNQYMSLREQGFM